MQFSFSFLKYSDDEDADEQEQEAELDSPNLTKLDWEQPVLAKPPGEFCFTLNAPKQWSDGRAHDRLRVVDALERSEDACPQRRLERG